MKGEVFRPKKGNLYLAVFFLVGFPIVGGILMLAWDTVACVLFVFMPIGLIPLGFYLAKDIGFYVRVLPDDEGLDYCGKYTIQWTEIDKAELEHPYENVEFLVLYHVDSKGSKIIKTKIPQHLVGYEYLKALVAGKVGS